MSRYPSLLSIVKATLDGMEDAENTYEGWSGGGTLSYTFEHVMYGFIAKSIMKLSGSKYVEVEPRARDSLYEARGRKTRLPESIKRGGHIDILLRWSSWKPRAVIEIKNNAYNYNGQCQRDITRIADMLCNTDVTLEFGIFAFFSSADTGKNKTARAKLEHRFNSLKSRVSDERSKYLKITGHHRLVEFDNSAYLVACIVMQPVKTD